MLGLKKRPWLELAKRRGDVRIADCKRCMREEQPLIRQTMGCGYLPPAPPGLPVRPWDHVGRTPTADEQDKDNPAHSVCPGYACYLPEVNEATWAHAYWDKGELGQWADGGIATPMVRTAIGVLAGEYAAASSWDHKNPEKR